MITLTEELTEVKPTLASRIKPLAIGAAQRLKPIVTGTGRLALNGTKKVLPVEYAKNVTTGFSDGLLTAGKAAVLGTGLALGAGYLNSINGPQS